MATDLLVSSPGAIRVVPVDKGVPAGFTVSVEGMTRNGSAYEELRAIVTGVGVAEQAAVQVTHALADMVHVYTFGDRMGEMRVSGLALLTDCKDPGLSGFAKVYKYWRANRPGKRKKPITVTLGTDFAVRGLLVGMTLSANNPALPVADFGMVIRYFPDVSTEAAAAPPPPPTTTPGTTATSGAETPRPRTADRPLTGGSSR